MRHKLVGILLPFAVLCLNVSPGLASGKPPAQDTDFKQIVSRLVDARQSGEVVIVGLKGGKSVSGKVVALNNEGFCIKHRLMEYFDDCTESVSYAEVLSVKERNPIVKVLKRIGAVPVIAAGSIVALPYAIYIAARGGM